MKKLIACLVIGCSFGCVTLTPEQSCEAICAELDTCGVAIEGSSLSSGSSCQADCMNRITTQGDACKGSAAYLADCFQTYTCDGIEVFCNPEAGAYADDCG